MKTDSVKLVRKDFKDTVSILYDAIDKTDEKLNQLTSELRSLQHQQLKHITGSFFIGLNLAITAALVIVGLVK